MSISRRAFFSGLASGAGLLAADTAHAGGPTKRFTGYEGRYGLLHDTTLCVGCRSCEHACYEVNEIAQRCQEWVGQGDDKPPPAPIGQPGFYDEHGKRGTADFRYTVVNRYRKAEGDHPAVYRKSQCMHCNEPCCAAVCFVKAFTKTPEGPVLYNPELCVGCRYCQMACPYYALSYEYDDPTTPRVVRCTMCYPRIKEGKNPACADACPTGAILFGERTQLLKVARERIRKHPDRYLDHVFGEHELGGTSWLLLAGISFAELGLPEQASHRPLPELVDGALSTVPLIVSMWPGLLLGFAAFGKRKEKLAERAREAAVAANQAEADEHLKSKLAAAAVKARKDKDKAVAQAAKKAKAEALQQAEAKAAQQAAPEVAEGDAP